MIQILVMDGVIVALAILLIVAQRLLVTYGECKITVTQESGAKELLVQGGDYLINYLSANNIDLSSSCGGKAICGYCKVQVVKGGGPILPTEEPFMTREAKLNGMRLGCQVKVRNDIEIYIPDYLTTVMDIVKNRTYDPNRKWRFIVE
ncbi:MAG: Na+-transporting NADH:ubiquinone oxidoreductase subunit [Candidatus Poribacteria bacterium]|nr:Na+-transporting NADH:ubiquinone oxidoreductase subunit [Candidatus Poribacteria bacterium]